MIAGMRHADNRAWADDNVAAIPMIETAEALGNLDDILSVPGVDAIYVGPADLSISLGLGPYGNDGNAVFDDALDNDRRRLRAPRVVPGIHASGALTPSARAGLPDDHGHQRRARDPRRVHEELAAARRRDARQRVPSCTDTSCLHVANDVPSAIRSWPARSWRISTSPKPASRTAGGPPRPDRRRSRAPAIRLASGDRGAPATTRRMASSPSAPANSARGSHSATDASRSASPSATYGGLLTITSNRSPAGSASNHDRCRPGRCGRPADPRQVRTSDCERVVADVGDPDRRPLERQLGRQRQPDRARAGAEVGDRRGGATPRPARSPTRRRARSPAAGSAPGGRPPGRGGGSPPYRARTAAARPLDSGRPSHRGGRPSARSPARRDRATNSSPSSAVATSHSHRASWRAPNTSAGLRPELADRDVPSRRQPSNSASWRARSSSSSGSTTRSRSPASTSDKR